MQERLFTINEVGFPDLSAMMFATIEAIKELGGSGSIQEIDEKVIEKVGLTEEEQSYTMSGHDTRPKVNYYLAWARTYLKKGGALVNSARGVWALTETGSQIRSVQQTEKIYKQVQLDQRKQTKENTKETAQDESPPLQTNDASDSDWKQVLLSTIYQMKPDAFERLSQRLLRETGFTKVEVRGKTGDGGIDGIGVLRVSLVSFQICFQCKRWQGSVGAREIRDFRGAIQGRADKGLFITTGYFTAQATDEATRDGAIAIDLIDGMSLCELLKDNKLGVATELVEQVEIDPNWFTEI